MNIVETDEDGKLMKIIIKLKGSNVRDAFELAFLALVITASEGPVRVDQG